MKRPILFAEPERSIEAYRRFLQRKVGLSPSLGFDVEAEEINPVLNRHQPDCVRWACRGGRRALFEAFGLGKTLQQLEIARLCLAHLGGGRALIVTPLGVRQEFIRDAALLRGDSDRLTPERRATLDAWLADRPDRRMPEPSFARFSAEVDRDDGLFLTNYESVRDGRLDANLFRVVLLDEASCLRGFGGTKTFREFMKLFEGNPEIRFKFVATATPSPNEYIELLAYAAFLEVMDVGQAKTRFFKRDSQKADSLTLHPHKEEEFWHWVNSWALFLQSPADLGYSDEGYALPPLDVRWHEIPSNHALAGTERDGQGRMFKNAAIGVVDAAREKRESLKARIAKMLELRNEDPGAHRLLWHDLEDERKAIEDALPDVASVFGSQNLEQREQVIIDFSEGRIQELAAKPVLAGSGCNFQKFCSWAIFLGIGFKFNDFIQAIHRVQRFLQTKPVRIDLIYTEAEREVRRTLQAKWARHNELVSMMTDIIRRYRLNQDALAGSLARTLGVERREAAGRAYRLILNDCVEEAASMQADSIDFGLTSIPFSTQYEYSPSFNDFGHTDNDRHFWQQMDFLIPQLLRVTKPGRVFAVHVKDRITPGGVNGLGFQTLSRFSDRCADRFEAHGWAFLGRKTVVTDVVRENNQTYRLGWSEHCKDGSRMGCGVPEYILLFRKPPSDRGNGYADEPVVKEKPVCDDHGEPRPFDSRHNWRKPVPGSGYTRALWQLDAHGFTRSSGDRLLSSQELSELPHPVLYKLWKQRSIHTVYNFKEHQAITEELDHLERLPATFMLLPPHSWHPDVWADVARMRTLNSSQAAKGREMHLCPLQFDICDRLIRQFSMPGEVVFDPFAGIGTVPYRAILLGRQGLGIELSASYWRDSVAYAEAAVQEVATPSLFDLLESEADHEAMEAAS